MRAKETLQLRHQLSASGLSLRAATYDTKRHHVLTFDSHPLRPHVLRLFSLRRELKSAPLFDKNGEEDIVKRDKQSSSTSNLIPTGATQGNKRPSFFELQQLKHEQEKHRKLKSNVEVVVPTMLLQYSTTLDVFICVYTTATRAKGSTKVPTTTTHSAVLLEPATLRKLLVYQGPETHLLQCAHYDPLTDKLVLAIRLKSGKCGHQDLEGDRGMLPRTPENVVEILQLSKRPDDSQSPWTAKDQSQPPTMLLVVENTRASLRHPDTLTLICGSRGLRELYGAASECSGATDTLSALLEWRQDRPNGGRFVLKRRVMHRHRITAMAVSPCGDWLLAGFCKGGLKVWNVNGSRTNESGLFTIDADPYEPTGSAVTDEVISSIEVTTTPTINSSNNADSATRSTDVIVIAAERNSGAIRHWKLSVEGEIFQDGGEASDSGEHRYPRLNPVGYFHSGGKEQAGKEGNPSNFKNQDTLGPPLKTLIMCVTIDMGNCFENLLLVVREDVIHVLKIQTVLYVMQEFAPIEETYAVRAIVQQDVCHVLSLSSTAACKLRIFPLDEASHQTSSSSKQLCVTPHASEISARVSSIETVTNDTMQLYFVVLAWSSGVVDVYDVLREKHVMRLQDKQLTDQISTLSVVTSQRVTKRIGIPTLDEVGEAGFLSSRSYGNLSQYHANNLADYATSDASDEAVARKTVIVVGTESGKLYGWNAEALWDDDLTFQTIQKANVRVQTAHSSHIIQLARIDAGVRGERALLSSVGAGGIIKLWSVPSLKMTGYVNSVAEGYPGTPSCIELMRGQKIVVGSGSQEVGELYVTVGYEDGQLAVWRVVIKQVSFQRLEVSAKHERRVSKICRISSDVVPTGLTEFLSCSLDMTVVQWQISESGNVQEKRYFDIGAAIVDMVLVKEQAVVALAHEVCKFVFAPSSKSDMKYLVKPGVETSVDVDKVPSEQQILSPTDDEYPDTPTTRSVENTTEAVSPSRRTSRSVEEYLTLHVPSAVIHLEAASSVADIATDSAPATREQHEELFNSRNETADKMPRYMRGSKSTDKLPHPMISDDILREYLREYIARHGTSGTMAANRITHLLALRPELPSIKRPGFVLAKSLKDLKLSAQTRVNSEEALQILRILFEMSFEASTMTHTLKQKENTSERTRAQRLRENKQARRKPVVTYNLLGEKYVRWEEDPAEQDYVCRNQSPSTRTNSLVVHTPPSPNMRGVTCFEDDSPSDDIGAPSQHATTNIDDVVPDTASSHDTLRVLADDSTPPSALPSEGNKLDATDAPSIEPNQPNPSDSSIAEEGNDEEDVEDEEEKGEEKEDNDGENDNDDEDNAATSKDQDHAKMAQAAPIKPTQATTSAIKIYRSKRAQRYCGPGDSISRNTLVNSIRLSPIFQQFWTKGYCWCKPAPRLHIVWTDNGKVIEGNGGAGNHKAEDTRRSSKCKVCHKRLHTVELPRVRYAPHFSRQATFDIIAEVYSKLTATAHKRLYKSASPRKEGSSERSIFSALYEVFQATYGMRSAVEMRLKLFFVSMCHFLPEYDAVAVFGELLGLHTPGVRDDYDQAPSTLVDLCVCCYSWFYSRGMVVNGDYFSGRLRGREWGTGCPPATTEAVPASDATTHWQFVRIEHALLCAQDNLLYPLVSPEFLRNIMLFMQEYTQQAPTRSLRTDSPDFAIDDIDGYGGEPALWVELHRFLRLLVGEWKHQNTQFRGVERLLFVHPQRDTVIEGDLLEKLRLMLSCFVFYDHERVGVMTISDFETLLFKLRYLWTEQCTAVDPTLNDYAFEDAVSASKMRFLDLNHDGQLCYLDFWVMLYIVGVKTGRLIRFHEIPSFCRDYRLEVSPELSDMVWSYMQLSCTLLLPKGLQAGKSSMDQKAERQHRRRVGGLHDGTFHYSKTLKGSLSTQELLMNDDTKKLGLFLDGSVPATRHTASTTALDRFRPVSVEAEAGSDSFSRQRGREPVVVGVRSTGPTPKPIALLSVSVMGNCDLLPDHGSKTKTAGIQLVNSRSFDGMTSEESRTAYTNTYIQFPQVPPVCRRVGAGLPNEVTRFPARQIIGSVPMEDDSGNEEVSIVYNDKVIKQDEQVQAEVLPTVRVSLTRTTSSSSALPAPEIAPLVQDEPVVVDQPEPLLRKPSLEKRRSTTTVVVVPTVETEVSMTPTSSQNELLMRPSSRGLVRVVSEQIKLEEVVAQLETDKAEMVSPPTRQPTPVVLITTAREEAPLESGRDHSQSVVSIDNGSEVDAGDVEQFSEHKQELPPEEPNEPTPILAEETTPEPEPVVQEIPTETVEPVVLQPSAEEAVAENDVELVAVVEDDQEQVVAADVIEDDNDVSTNEEVNSTPTPESCVEPDPAEVPVFELDATSEVAHDGELSESTVDTQDMPQVVKEDDIQIHHAFRFSRQPTFLHSVAVSNNPYRTAMWNPNDDSDSDDAEHRETSASKPGGFDVDESSYSSENEYATGTAKPKHPEEESAISQLSPSSSASTTGTTLKPQPSPSHLPRFDSRLQPPLRNKKISPLEYQFSEDLEAIQDEDDDNLEAITDAPLIPFRRKRLDEEAERALYGERIVNVLGEGIAFSSEAEAAMQQKWQLFFDDSESKMFATMRHDLEKKQTEQREAEERQRKLRKKWQEQRDQDLQRLQNSRQTSSILMSTKQTDSTDGAVDASFRLRRIHRESCRQLTEELQFGVSVQRELNKAKDTQFFHFFYLPQSHGTIITLKMHVLRGDAEVFMSADTKVPCATDFMWRSSERMVKDSGEGHRIVLYPHDLLRIVTAATANAASTEQATALVETNTSTMSSRSFNLKQPDATCVQVGFYLSVVALEPGTTFTLAAMSSGQKMQPSHAIRTVDYLIDRFNMISRSFQGQSTTPFSSSDENRVTIPPDEAIRNDFISRQAFADNNSDAMDEDDENEETTGNESTEFASRRRKTKKILAEGVDPQELKSFQRLLETLSEKKGFASPRAASILLAGPSEEHLEFVQDEDQRLQEMHRRLSPPKSCREGSHDHHDSISVVAERRLTLQGKRQKLRRVVAARLQQKLAPLRHKLNARGELEKSASAGMLGNFRLAKTAPRPVAYSLTTLDPIPRSHRFKAATSPLAQTKRMVIEKGSRDSLEKG